MTTKVREHQTKCGGCGQAVKVEIHPLAVRYSNLDSNKAHKCK